MRKLYIRWFALIAVIIMMMDAAMPVLAATPPEPTYGSADVDGNPSEWDLDNDFFADMWEAGRPDKPNPQKLSKAYLRYDCPSRTLYVLVLANPGYQIMANKPDDNWVKIYDISNSTLVDGNSGDDGTPPDFAWIGQNGKVADGWEASIKLDPKTYEKLEIHAQIVDAKDEDGRTSSTGKEKKIQLTLTCLSLGDFIWNDQDGDGIQDGGEPGIDGVPVWLFTGVCDLTSDYNSLTPFATTVTTGGGYYKFKDLNPGNYCVVIPGSAFGTGQPLAGFDPTTLNSGSDDGLDSDGQQSLGGYVYASVTLTNRDDDTIDFGFVRGTPTAVTLSALSARSGMAWPAGSLVWIAAGIALAGAAALHRRR